MLDFSASGMECFLRISRRPCWCIIILGMYPDRASTHYRNIYLDDHIHFFTCSIVGFLPVLEVDPMKQLLLDSWNIYREKYNVLIHGYVIMPEHIHILLYADMGVQIRSFIQQSLRLSAITILEKVRGLPEYKRIPILDKFKHYANGRAKYKIWKEQARGIPLDKEKYVVQRLNYIHENPVRRELVKNPLDYLYSSYRNYELDDQSVFRIDKI